MVPVPSRSLLLATPLSRLSSKIQTGFLDYIFLNTSNPPDTAWPNSSAQGPKKSCLSQMHPMESTLFSGTSCGTSTTLLSRVGGNQLYYYASHLCCSDDNLSFLGTDCPIYQRFTTASFCFCVSTELSDHSRIHLAEFSRARRHFEFQSTGEAARNIRRDEVEDCCCY